MSSITRRAFLTTTAATAAAACISRAGAQSSVQPAMPPSTAPATTPATGPATRAVVVRGTPLQPYPPTLEAWRAAYGKGEVVQKVRRPELLGWLPSPHIGTTTFQRFNGDPVNTDGRWNDAAGPEAFGPIRNNGRNDRYPQTTIAYCRWLWTKIEPEQGKYRWDFIEGALRAAAERGQTLQMRLQPFSRNNLPRWFTEGKDRFVEKDGKRQVQHNSEDYIRAWGDLIRAFGQKFDGHPNLESFDVAYGGAWGEGGGNSTPETAARLVDVYVASLKKTQLTTMLGTHGCRYAATLKGVNIGWRADCFGDMRFIESDTSPAWASWNHMLDSYPQSIFRCGVQDAWKTAPVTFETCHTVNHWFLRGSDIDFILEQGLAYHASIFMPKSNHIPDEWADKIDAFNNRLGYRFVLRQMLLPLAARPREALSVEFFIENIGVAPIYRPYTLALRLRQGDTQRIVPLRVDPRTWMPGINWFSEQVMIPDAFVTGPVAIDLAMIDPATQAPRVPFAIKGIGPEGWYPMTFLNLDPQASTAPIRDLETGRLRPMEVE